MRISDWSSDVCSSDVAIASLVMPASGMPRHAGEELTMVRISRSDWILAWNRDLRPVALASLIGFQLLKQRICPIRRHSLHRQNFFAWQLVRQSAAAIKLGRPSGREKVCRSV